MNGTLRFISDFRELDKIFPIPKIQDLILTLQGFKYSSPLDLNIGSSRKLCTIMLPWGNMNIRNFQWVYVIAQIFSRKNEGVI